MSKLLLHRHKQQQQQQQNHFLLFYLLLIRLLYESRPTTTVVDIVAVAFTTIQQQQSATTNKFIRSGRGSRSRPTTSSISFIPCSKPPPTNRPNTANNKNRNLVIRVNYNIMNTYHSPSNNHDATTTTTTDNHNMIHPSDTAAAADTSSYQEENDETMYAFQANVVSLSLPDPPDDKLPVYLVDDKQQDIVDTNDKDTYESMKYSIVKVPTRMNYLVGSKLSRDTVIRLYRDVNGNDSSNNNTNGMGWFTNHRTIWVHNGRLGIADSKETSMKQYTLDQNGFELITHHRSSGTSSTNNTNSNNDDLESSVQVLLTVKEPSSISSLPPPPKDIDYMNRDDVMDRYYPFCTQLLQQHLQRTTSSRSSAKVHVYAFDHNVRKQPPPPPPQSSQSSNDDNEKDNSTASSQQQSPPPPPPQKPIGLVHGDYTTVSGPRRIELLGQEPKVNDVWYHRLKQENHPSLSSSTLLDPTVVQECLQGQRRYALINVWRNIDPDHPVMALPLACVDATTVQATTDLRTLELHYVDRIGENYLACHPTVPSSSSSDHETIREHKWVYFPCMDYNESLLIKQWDSVGDIATAATTEASYSNPMKAQQEQQYISTMALHSAFIDPITPTDSPLRQSIEVRCVAIWDP